ncbi:MAG: hypothetical protein IJB55_01520 [Firmicutes bacterium]|nr:hypothetical protein [Bacillota bacterium]
MLISSIAVFVIKLGIRAEKAFESNRELFADFSVYIDEETVGQISI